MEGSRLERRGFCQGQMAGGEAEALLEPAPRSQLDRLLAGLDELSGTLPDLTANSWTPARPATSSQAAEQRGGRAGAVQCSAGAGRAVNAAGGAVRAAPVNSGGVSGQQGCSSAGEQGGQVVMGRQGRPGGPNGSLAARSYEEDVDYALEKDGERRRGGEEGAPYHTRYDSKPFSYIR